MTNEMIELPSSFRAIPNEKFTSKDEMIEFFIHKILPSPKLYKDYIKKTMENSKLSTVEKLFNIWRIKERRLNRLYEEGLMPLKAQVEILEERLYYLQQFQIPTAFVDSEDYYKGEAFRLNQIENVKEELIKLEKGLKRN